MAAGRSLGPNLLLALGSVAVVLMLAEAGARLARSLRGPETDTDFSAYTEYDPLLGWRKRPGSRAVLRRREYTVEVAVNSHGLRGPDRPYENPAGAFRILALGDSFVEGYTVPEAETVSALLERSLQGQGYPVEVLNGGTVAYSTDQEYLFYRTEGVRYAPAVVVLFVYYNDILYNDLQNAVVPKPVFVFRQGRLELFKTPVDRPRHSPRGAEEEMPRGRSALLDWIKERLWFGAPTVYNALGRLGLWPPTRPVGARLEYRVYERRKLPEIEGGWEKTRALLEALAREVKEGGARFAVAYVPAKMEASERAWSIAHARLGVDDVAWDRTLVRRRLEDIVRALGVPFLDLTPALRQEEERLFGGAYYTYDGHWNAVGHRLAARELEGLLRQQGWLPVARGR